MNPNAQTQQLSKSTKKEIFLLFIEDPGFKDVAGPQNIIDFINDFYVSNTKELLSEDRRYDNFEEELTQHYLHNDDWDILYIFIDRLRIIEDNETFIKFISTTLKRLPTTSASSLLFKINSILSKHDLILRQYGGRLSLNSVEQENKLLGTNSGIYFYVIENFDVFEEKNCIVLVHDNWDDFSHKTSFKLFVILADKTKIEIGLVKIMKKGFDNTLPVIPVKFLNLDKDFCSLGQESSYYKGLDFISRKINLTLKEILLSLRDVGYYPEIREEFEDDNTYKTSLIRYDTAERISRYAKLIVESRNLISDEIGRIRPSYKFSYLFNPVDNQQVKIEFRFSNNYILPHRLTAIIGKNGAGKTQLLNSLPYDLYLENKNRFEIGFPIFGKIISVSTSIFDRRAYPNKTAEFNYVRCSFKDEKGEIMSRESLYERFAQSVIKISNHGRTDQWKSVLHNIISPNIIDRLFKEQVPNISKNIYEFSFSEYEELKDKFSSGENIIIFILTEIISEIRYDSLILYDEPETYLHPNAIAQLVNSLYEILSTFDSYCIIATHSPVIIQEVFSSDVRVLERNDGIVSVRGIQKESLGDNLTSITEEIFSKREHPKHFQKTIQDLVKDGKDYNEIESLIKNGDIPLNENLAIFIKSLILQKNEEHQ